MNQLQTFNHPMFGELPVLIIDGVEWFGATEAAKALSFSDPHKAINNHVEEDDSTVHPVIDSLGRNQKKKFTNESGLYSLIFGATRQGNNPKIRDRARRFKRWVTSEVLPTIRKTGGYVQKDRAIDFVNIWLPQLDEHTKLAVANTLEENRKVMAENKVLKITINDLKPKADYTDVILRNKGLVTITQIAKDYGMSAQEMNELLHELKIQYKQSGQWLLYRKYDNEGYVHSETIQITRSDGRPDVKMNTKWTQKGRLFIYQTLKARGILPLIERELAKV